MCGCEVGADYTEKGAFRMCRNCSGHSKESEVVEQQQQQQEYYGFVVVDEDSDFPKRATAGSAGYDLCASHDVIIRPGEWKLVKTGVSIKLPRELFFDLRARSGLALKHGVTLQNGTGVIDSDYFPNEIGVILRNEGDIGFQVKKGDRIAQGIILPYYTADVEEIVNEREGGFGSTGVE